MTERFDNDVAASARRRRALPNCTEGRRRAKTFLMVFMGHSGSSALLSELRQHPLLYVEKMELVDHQEVFNSTAALAETRAFFERGIRRGKVPGFKIRPMHLLVAPELFRALVRLYDTRIIWQYRQNLFKAAVGEYSTRYLNDSRAVEGLRSNLSVEERCASGAGCRFRIEDMSFLHETLCEKVKSHHLITNAVHSLTDGRECVREIPYEDYLYDREATMRDVFKFLGVAHRWTVPQRFKATKDNMCEVIDNWADVCRELYGCITWQPMLDDARNGCFCNFSSGPVKYCETFV